MPNKSFNRRLCGWLAAAVLSLAPALGAGHAARAQVNVLTQHNDNSRTGANLRETVLNTSNVNAGQFGKLFSRAVDGQIYAQPLYVAGLSFPGKGRHNAVFVATEHNSVYAFDADDSRASAPLWQVNLGPSIPYTDFYKTEWTDMNEEVGITSTPVIDLHTGTIYVEAKTKENGGYFHRLHALDLRTGDEKFGSPVTIQAQVRGTAPDAVGGVVKFQPFYQLQRPALLLSNGIVYLGFGSHADMQPFHGWVLGYDARTLRQVAVFNTTPNGQEGAIWQAGQGLVADASGNIYAAAGNGDSDVQIGGSDLGECLLKLTPTPKGLTLADWFMPFNFDDLNSNDTDLGACGPVLVPGTDTIVMGSKEGVMYVAKRDGLGHYHQSDDSQILQNFPAGNGHIHGSPVVWRAPDGRQMVYVWSENDNLKSFQEQDGKYVPAPVGPSRLPYGMPGGFLSVSSDGARPGTGIVWAARPLSDNANWNTVAGLLQAFDAADVSKELWDSRQNAGRDDVGSFAKFCPPTVADGKVYVATFSRRLNVYGLLPKAKTASRK